MDDEWHVPDPTELADLDVPAATKQVLAHGLPPRVAISSVSPTVFTSALADGCVPRTPAGSRVDGYVIGSIREQLGQPVDYSWFVIERRTGAVYVTDHLRTDTFTSFVNSDVSRFLASIQALVAVADEARRAADENGQDETRLCGLLRERLAAIDPPALARSGYWQAWLDDLLI